MINLGYSLQHVLDTESARRGLTRAEMIECICDAIRENFKRRGKLVNVTVDDTEDQAVISAVETILTGASQAMYREVKFIPPFSPELLAECIEHHLALKQKSQRWALAEAKVVRCADDHYLIEVLSTSNPQSELEGQIAVLPHKSVAEDDGFRQGDVIWTVVRSYMHGSIDGDYMDAWRNVEAELIASRTESEFLALMAYKMLNEPVHCVIHTSRGILIFPPGHDLQPLLGNEGKYKNMLQRLTGLKRLAVARQPAAPEVHKRLIHTIREVANLKYSKDYLLGTSDPNELPKIYVSPNVVKRFVGTSGHNLFFIKCVSGIEFTFEAKRNMTQSSSAVTRTRAPTEPAVAYAATGNATLTLRSAQKASSP